MMTMLEQQLHAHVSGEVRFDDMARVLYSTDASNYQVYPRGVVLPKTLDDVITTIKLCAEHDTPITARGGGSSLAGQSIGPGVVIDTSKYMDQLIALDTASFTAHVQSGMVLGVLNKKLSAHGLQFGPDPASAERATVGGVIGTNGTGAHSIRYGMTADQVVALKCVMADGSVVEFAPRDLYSGQTALSDLTTYEVDVQNIVAANADVIRRDFPQVWRRASGYNVDFVAEMLSYDAADPTACLTAASHARNGDNYATHVRQVSRFNLAPLIAGAEGTLAFVAEATLNVVPKPKHTALVVLAFDELYDAMRCVPTLLTTEPSALELISTFFIRAARDLHDCKDKMGWVEGAPEVLVLEFDGEDAAQVQVKLAHAQQLVEREHLPCRLSILTDAKSQSDLWTVRKLGLAVLMSIRSDYKPISIIEDVAVPVAQLENYVRALDEVFAKFNTHGAYYAHASAGVLHVRPLLNLRTVEGVQAVEAIGDAALKLCQTMGGAMSGEHGDGYERTHYNEALFGREVYQTFCAIKDVFDPRGIMNPGKKVRADDKHALKLGPDTHLKPIATTFLYRGDGDIAHLSEECNGAGVCRKLDGGVMCPSYRVTRDEMHSTRGRANLLRHLMRAPAEDPFNQTEDAKIDNVKAALDLCLSCKACLGECGSRVDMAKMKSDFTQMYFDRRGTPLRARILGHIAALSRLATLTPLTARMANALINTRALKRALRLADRPLPAFALEPFDVWWRKRTTPAYQNSAQTVALFIDTFTRYNHPHIGVAAVNVLEALGYRVVVPQSVCCGRPLVSQGQPRAAKKLAQQNADILAPFIQQNIPVVALEPSCITMLNEDTADLVGTSLGVRAIEDFVAEVLASSPEHAEGVASTNPALLDRSASALSHSGNTVLLHGHCHQKASYGVNGTLSALRQLGYDAHTFDSTCCGMAGAFGFEAEHAGLSQRVGELGVLPTVRAANSDTLVAAAGTSCRQQIGELAPRESLHPIELIARAMFDSHAETLSH